MGNKDRVIILDPSDTYRPEKKEEKFRDYDGNSSIHDRVRRTYNLMHTHQTYDFVTEKENSWGKLDKAEMTIMECLAALDDLVDESDPDADFPNHFHAYQTAEGIRQAHPDKPWFHLTGLIHDIGKMMALWGEPQWCVVGDTFPVGCKFSDKCVFGEGSFKSNPDYNNPKYNTELGVYAENTGLDNIKMSWGHDEYLYRVLKGNTCHLTEEALYMIRYHSFYPWHTSGAYDHLVNNKDREMMKWVLEFNKFDLYTKCETLPDVEELKPYYEGLIREYIPGKLRW